MKKALLVAGFAGLLACEPTQQSAEYQTPDTAPQLAKFTLDYLRDKYRSEETNHFTVYLVVDSTVFSEYLSPEYSRYPADERVQNALRWLLRVPTQDILAYDQDSYLVHYYYDDTDGNHYPASSYMLIGQKNGAWCVEKSLKRADDDIDLTLLRLEKGRLFGERMLDRFGEKKQTCWLHIRGDSLLIDPTRAN